MEAAPRTPSSGDEADPNQQLLLVVNEADAFQGRYVLRGPAHTGGGERHRAFVCMVVNRLGQVLLQRRKHWLWDDLWDLSAVSHVLHLEDRDETYGEAAARALEREMGIQGVRVQKLAGFNYYAKHPRGEGCENEYCAVMLARHDGPVKADPDCVYEHRWLGLEDFRAEVEARPETYTPWAALTVATLSEAGRWPPLPYRP